MQKVFIYHEKIVLQVSNFGTGGKLALAERGYKFCGVNRHDGIACCRLHCMQRSVPSPQIQIMSERPEQCDFCCRVDCGGMTHSLAACFLSVITR